MSTERVPVDDPDAVRRILANADALLLDFDGPICDVFAGLPAHVVADQLRRVLAEGGHDELPAAVEKSEDPFDVFYYAATLGDEEARYVEASQRAHEVEAVASSTPIPYAHDLIGRWHTSGRMVAVVSNNSAAAVETYLHLHELTARIDCVSARDDFDPSHLKPNPFLIQRVCEHFKISATRSVMVGDSSTDIQAAHAAGTPVIGYANRPDKLDLLASKTPQAIVTDLAYLYNAL
ncbi:HAD family hydrolase [Lentzea fradiae]|uniref:HAD family hydrolase n=1 Tax=Lentzea fradiae TaxID=200378 RepID=UPI000B259C1C|nr:HAD-IIIA family hydrolase [Lentzea fradiae]